MSVRPGMYSGGVRCVETLKQRCYVDIDTGCWHWKLAIRQGAPTVHVHMKDGTTSVMRGRRAANFLATGSVLKEGQVAFAKLKCRSRDCVNPDHTQTGDRHALGAYLRASGRSKLGAHAIASLVEAARKRKDVKLSIEKAREIRLSADTQVALAKKYGVPQSRIYEIRSGKAWKETAPATSVFDWANRGAV